MVIFKGRVRDGVVTRQSLHTRFLLSIRHEQDHESEDADQCQETEIHFHCGLLRRPNAGWTGAVSVLLGARENGCWTRTQFLGPSSQDSGTSDSFLSEGTNPGG